MSTAKERAYHGAPIVTPERAAAWQRWIDDYAIACSERWIEDGATHDEALRGIEAIQFDFARIEPLPWMPLGEAMVSLVSAELAGETLGPNDTERFRYMLATRTHATAPEADKIAAIAYQLGISIQQARSLSDHINSAYDEPDSSGETALYRYFDARGTLLYVGITKDPAIRDEQHRHSSAWHRFVSRRDVEWHASREAARQCERQAIGHDEPLFNTANASAGTKARAIDYLFSRIEERAMS